MTGEYNTMIGVSSGALNTTGYLNTFVGYATGNANTTGFGNAFFGHGAGAANTVGIANTFIGNGAGNSNTSAQHNTFIGGSAGVKTTTGPYNSFIGNRSGFNNTVGFGNAFVGYEAGYLNTSGIYNAFFGYGAGYDHTIGDSNVMIGPLSGASVTSGSQNVLIGYKSKASNNLQNASAIGSNSLVNVSNAIVLGDTAKNTKVGIGITAPQFPLDVRGIINLRNNGTIKFSHLSNPFLRNGYTDQFLTVNEEGETVLAHHRLRIDNVNQWSDKVFSPMYKLKPLAQVELYIQQHGYLPNIPSAEQVVKEGIDPAKMDAKLLEKIEELTLYSIEQDKKIKKQEERIEQLEQIVKQLFEKK
ncbi:hypothetical protein [Spirosoma flavus]